MLLDFRCRPLVIGPTFLDGIGTAAGTLAAANHLEHLVKGRVAADAMAAFEEVLYAHQHRPRIREIQPVRIALNDRTFVQTG